MANKFKPNKPQFTKWRKDKGQFKRKNNYASTFQVALQEFEEAKKETLLKRKG
jgi:hypothetical protein